MVNNNRFHRIIFRLKTIMIAFLVVSFYRCAVIKKSNDTVTVFGCILTENHKLITIVNSGI